MAKLKHTMACGCVVAIDYDETLALIYCPKHAAAPELYEALKAVDEYFEAPYPDNMALKRVAVKLTEEALSKAEKGE